MPYRLRYTWNIDWVGTGMNAMSGSLTPLNIPAGGAQTLGGVNAATGQNIVGTGTGGAILGADITTITTAMAADVAAQANLAPNLAKLQGFATGGL
jgi:hypothetical protein